LKILNQSLRRGKGHFINWLRELDGIEINVIVFGNIYWNGNQQHNQTANYEEGRLVQNNKFSFSPKISWTNHSLIVSYFTLDRFTSRKLPSPHFFVQLKMLALRYSHYLQTAWCQLQSFQVPQSNSKQLRSSKFA
jgi:hypothetical protein